MSKFINPFSDYGFKLIFRSEVSKDLIISFLNSVIQDEVIVNITFRNVEMLGMKHDQRKAVFDIFCENEKGEFFIVEMQKARQKYFSDRILYYASFAIQQQSIVAREKIACLEDEPKKAYWDYSISKVYIVCILNYVMEPSLPHKYRWDVVRMDRELKVPFSETLNEVYFEMPKFVLPLSECNSIYLKWLYVLNNIDIMDRLPEELNNQLFRKLKSIVEIERMSANERLEYELSLAVERDMLSALDASREEGLVKGRAEGLAEGEAKGEAKGLAEGLRQTAINMKRTGLDVDTIVNCTGLSKEEILAL